MKVKHAGEVHRRFRKEFHEHPSEGMFLALDTFSTLSSVFM